MRILVVASLAVVALAACTSREASKPDGNTAVSDNQLADQNDKLANVNPCSLLTDDEIITQVDLTYEHDQREAMHAAGIKHHITKDEDRSGAMAVCRVSWRAVEPNGQESARGSFEIQAMTATQLKALEGMSRPKEGERAGPIAGAGDEAFYLEYQPAARVGDVGVSISDFPATWGDEANQRSGAETLLRAAAQRLR
jgi:hypothetical protein